MDCPKCSSPMVIDTWNGWRWICFHCDYTGRIATYEEIEEDEKQTETLSRRQHAKTEKKN